MKKRLSIILLTAALLVACCASLCGCAGKTAVEGDYEYKTLRGHAAEIVRYLGEDEEPAIPAEFDGRAVTAIGESAFAGNITLTGIDIPEGVKDIGDYAFECCPKLARVSFPASLREVGEGAFSGCTALEEVALSDGVESYGDGAFFFCRRLRSFELTESVREVGDFLFGECRSLGTVTIGGNVREISDRMFCHCESLTAVEVPASVGRIGEYAFRKCYMLQKVSGAAGVTEIASCAFEGCNELSAFDWSDKLVTIRENAFLSCYGLTAADIPATAENIEPGAFMGINLANITVDPENERYTVADGVLFTKDMSTLVLYPNGSERTEYTVPAGVTTIAPYAFRCTMNLTKLTLPDGLTTLGEGAFKEMHNVAKLVVPDSVTLLGDFCFDCTGFEEVVLGKGVTALGRNTFSSCYSLRRVTFPEGLTSIGAMTFAGCEKLESINIPGSVTEVDGSAFTGTLCPIVFAPGAFRVENGILYSDDGKTLVQCLSDSDIHEFTVPDGVERIGAYAFDGNLQSITLPDSVTEIGENAFGTFRSYYGPDMGEKPLVNLRVFGSENSAARAYAEANDLAFFTSGPRPNTEAVTLEGGAEFGFVIEGATDGSVTYTSKDPSIASVDDNGIIRAHKTGTTSVVAAVGTAYFKCDVNVTSDGEPNPDVIDGSGYTHILRGDGAAWVADYMDFNKDNLIFEPDSNPYASAYKGESYYEGMWAAQVPDGGEYDEIARDMFGDNYRGQLGMMDHGLVVELGRYEQPDDVLLYSGTASFERFIGKKDTVRNIKDAVGTIITEPYFFSTALDQSVSHQFGGAKNCIFEIYADKDVVQGGYIECTVGQGDGGEYELLMPANARFEVLDAGVREVSLTTANPNYYPEEVTSFERFMKVRLLDFEGGTAAEEAAPAREGSALDALSPLLAAYIIFILFVLLKKNAQKDDE